MSCSAFAQLDGAGQYKKAAPQEAAFRLHIFWLLPTRD
jgi:hypothetical protein